MTFHTVYLSLGSNIGDRRAMLSAAIAMLNKQAGNVIRQSRFYETEPWGFTSPNKFLNAAVCLRTSMSPYQLLDAVIDIERALGRRGKTSKTKYEDRTIDIDILLYDDVNIDTDALKIPHPLMRQREFVMTPLREIMSDK